MLRGTGILPVGFGMIHYFSRTTLERKARQGAMHIDNYAAQLLMKLADYRSTRGTSVAGLLVSCFSGSCPPSSTENSEEPPGGCRGARSHAKPLAPNTGGRLAAAKPAQTGLGCVWAGLIRGENQFSLRLARLRSRLRAHYAQIHALGCFLSPTGC